MKVWTGSGVFPVLCALAWTLPAVAGHVRPQASRHTIHRDTSKLDFPEGAAAKARDAAGFLRAHAARYQFPADLSNLEWLDNRQSLLGTHSRYRQMLNGIPVEGAEIIVSRRQSDGAVFQVYNNTWPVTAAVPAAKNLLTRNAALEQAWNQLRVHGNLTAPPEADLMYVPGKSGFRLVYKTLLFVTAPAGYWEHKVDAATGEILSVRRHEINRKHARDEVPDFSLYRGPVTPFADELARFESAAATAKAAVPAAKGVATNGTALVFDPDPRTTLNDAALVDSSPAASFNGAYFSRTLQGISLDGGVYTLEGPYVVITNMPSELPATPVSTSTSGSWTNRRGSNAFNDVMCYFHIDQNQRYLQSLGYTGATGIQTNPIPVDSDGLDGDDNSHYVPLQNSLAFGHGGVDDDEDADVIIHEYGHAITFDILPTWGGGDADAIGEGFGDYWGASYSWSCSNGSVFNPAWAFSWDGHSADTWAGRTLDMTNLTYDHSRNYGAHEYIDGIPNYSDQLWGTPIYMAFRDLIAAGRPREEMDTIMIEAFYGVGYGVKMRDLANVIVNTAQTLYPAGPHAEAYYNRFINQLILPVPDPSLVLPGGGETFTTGAVISVQWDRNGAPSRVYAELEYTTQLSGDAAYFFDPVETGTNGWVVTSTTGTNWEIVTTANYSPTHSWYAMDDEFAGDQFLTRSGITVSNGAALSFWHWYNLESGYDGGVVEISTNGGSSWVDLGTNALMGGYNGTIDTDYSSPIAGREAFTGNSGGFTNTIIPLDAYAGQTVAIRFRESDDSSVNETGWWVDDIAVGVSTPWTPLATTPTNASTYSWTLPATPGTNYGVRVRQAVAAGIDSAWAVSPAFTLVPAVNHVPTNILLPGTNVLENQAVGTLVGSFATQDPDPGNTFTYTLVAGPGATDNALFSIAGSNLLAAASFNYELQDTRSIRVQSVDQGSLAVQKIFTIQVGDVPEPPPAFSGLVSPSGSNMVVHWSSLSNHTYTIYESTNLTEGFTILQGGLPATPDVNSFTDTVTTTLQKYWKIETDP